MDVLLEFLQDYTGRETGMLPFKKGERGLFPFAMARDLIGLGICKYPDEEETPVKKSKRSERSKAEEVTDDENQ
jgi:hypothetical protein